MISRCKLIKETIRELSAFISSHRKKRIRVTQTKELDKLTELHIPYTMKIYKQESSDVFLKVHDSIMNSDIFTLLLIYHLYQ